MTDTDTIEVNPPEIDDPLMETRVPRPKVLISGYYGFNNLGDELILSVLINHLQQQGAEISVISSDPDATQRRHGVHAIHRANAVELVHALSQSHLFVSGGGGLFQDASGPLNSFYYAGMIGLARYFEVPVCFWGQGLGPLTLPVTEWVTKQALHWSDKIAVRDDASAQIVTHLLGEAESKKKLTVATDPVWLYDMPAPAPHTVHDKNQKNKDWLIGISLRPSAELTDDRLRLFAGFLKKFVDGSPKPVQFLLLPFQEEEDMPILLELERILVELNAGNFKIVDPHHVIDHLQQCHILFGMRFHSIVLAALADVAVYGIIYDPKVRQLLKQLGLQGVELGALDQLNDDALRQYFQRYPAPDLMHITQQARQNLEILDTALATATAELTALL